jgi:putative ABC transport system substrate-binding protein
MSGMRRRDFITLVGCAVACPLAARAQQSELTRRLGVLMPFQAQDPFGRQIVSALREGLKERGWADGRNIRFDERWIGGDDERRNRYAVDLVRSSPDVIFACFAGQLAALLRETRTIPIVFAGVSDPVAADMSIVLRIRAATSLGSFLTSRRWWANGWVCSKRLRRRSPASDLW